MGAITTWAIGLMMTKVGRLALATLGVLAIVQMFAWKNQNIGAAREVAKMERASDANAQKAEKARHSVDKVPDDKLRDRYRRD